LLEGVEYSPQMERVFVDILKEVCLKEENRNWESFYEGSEHYLAENKGQISFLEQSIVAIEVFLTIINHISLPKFMIYFLQIITKTFLSRLK